MPMLIEIALLASILSTAAVKGLLLPDCWDLVNPQGEEIHSLDFVSQITLDLGRRAPQ